MAFPLPESNPEALGLDPRPLERLCATIERHIAEGHHPGAQVAVAARRGDRLDSYAWGEHQWLPNGNLLITEPFGGRAFEITTGAEPRLVWEHVNGLGERDGEPVRGLIGEARRFAYDELPFVRRPAAPTS